LDRSVGIDANHTMGDDGTGVSRIVEPDDHPRHHPFPEVGGEDDDIAGCSDPVATVCPVWRETPVRSDPYPGD
jgi:hypothetical protein